MNFIDAVTFMLPANKHLVRYADLLRNMLVTAVALSIFPKHAMTVLVCLLTSSLVAYFVDRLTLVRDFAQFQYSTDFIDAVAIRLLALPVSILAMNFYAQLHGPVCPLPSLIGVAVLHTVFHQLLISAARHDSHADLKYAYRRDYQAVDRECAVGWFSGSPVHGLREKHVLKKTLPPRVVCAGVSPHWNPRWYFAAEEIKSRFYNGEYFTKEPVFQRPSNVS